MTKLVEFKNDKQEVLRGLLDTSESERGVLFIHGYERTTVEYKFKNIVDKLHGQINLFRFDFSGCGLSDGDFSSITTEKYVEEIEKAIETFQKEVSHLKYITLIAHSFASCAVLEFLQKELGHIENVVFLAPAWNQKVLHRYWLAQSRYRTKKEDVTISNYFKYVDEEIFQDFVHIEKRQSKAHYINKEYFLENEKKDYQDKLSTVTLDYKNILVVHGEDDRAVPIGSNNKIPKDIQIIRVIKGDHELERMNMVKQYLNKVIDFVLVQESLLS